MKTKLLFLAFTLLSIIAKPQTGYIYTIAGTGTFGYTGDGDSAISAHLNNPNGLAFDAAGNVYFADLTNNVIRKVTKSTGKISTVVGTYYTGSTWNYGGDGGPADSAWLGGPLGIATDTAGNLYIADNLNNVIRKVTASTGIITTVAGDFMAIDMPWAFSGDGGPATSAELNSPWGVALDAAGNIYIADQGYDVIRKVTVSTGIITTVAGNGNGGYTGDGGLATSAELNAPDGVTIDAAGNIYISDDGNNVIRKVTASTGKISTIAGYRNAGYSGDGGPADSAKLNDPSLGVAIDAAGNIYIADDGNNVIRRVDASTGKISTICGNGNIGYTGDGGPADSALLNGPEAVALDDSGNIYISDGNNVIREIRESMGSAPATPGTIHGNASVCYGNSGIYSVAPVSGATSYTWTLPHGWNGTSTTDTIIATTGVSGNISVTANNSFGTSPAQSIHVTVNTVDTSVTQSGLTLTANATGAAYVWINCNGRIPVTGAIHQSFTATTQGNYAVIVTQNGCTDTSACFTVDTATGSVPSTPGAIHGSASICYGSAEIYSISPVSGATSYTWTLPHGWNGTSTTDTIIATTGVSGNISVTANNSFGPSPAQSIHVTVNTVDTSVTQSGLTLTANATGAAYVWINCNGRIPVTGATHQSFIATTQGNYAVIVTQNGCTDTSTCFMVDTATGSVPSTPGAIQGSASICYGSTEIYSVSPVSGATSYTWTLPNGWNGTSTTDTIIATSGVSGNISVTANNSFGPSPAQTIHVTVNTVDTSVTQSGLMLTANATGAAYVWINCNGRIPVTGATHQSFTATTQSNYAVIVTQNGCTDTSACFMVDTGCNISITGADLPYSGLSVLLAEDTVTQVTLGNPGESQTWNYSMLADNYNRVAIYNPTASTPYASAYPASNIYTYGPDPFFGSLYGGAPTDSAGSGYIFWKSDTTGLWEAGFRAADGTFAGINVQDNPLELLLGAPASYGSVFNNSARWVLPFNQNLSGLDTFYVKNMNKIITADACGSITTPYGQYPNVLREHEHVIQVDSVYLKMGGTQIAAVEYARDTLNNYSYIAHGIGYPVCIVHTNNRNTITSVEYFSGILTSINNLHVAETRFLLYPNPSDGNLTIEILNPNNGSVNNIFIYNSIGSLVWQKNTSDAKINIDASSLAKGIYLVKMVSGDKILTAKIIIQ
jgi:sugar lactone lactonase YvrE